MTKHEIEPFETERLLALIGNIYDAALDVSLWKSVLHKATRFTGGCASSLFCLNPTAKSGSVFYQDGGIEQQFVDLYFNEYIKLDPTATGHFFAEVEQLHCTADIMPYEEFYGSRFYKEWAKPQGLIDCATVQLEKSVTTASFFNVFRHERHGKVDDDMRHRVRSIVPHIRRAVLIGNIINLKQAEAACFADVCDNLTAGMFLVDSSGRIVHANVSGHVILAAGDFLRAMGGRLVATDPQIDDILRKIFIAADSGDTEVGIEGIALPLKAQNGDPYLAHVLPLTSGSRRRAGANYKAVAALFIRKADMNMRSVPEVFAKTYKLTPTELRVLLAVVEVGGVPEVATALGIADTTVRTHLGRLFEKTGTGRQADLVKLVAGFSNQLVN